MRNLKLLAVAALLAASSMPAWAQAPVVSNVTFAQSANGTTGTMVDVYYDLTSAVGNCNVAAALSNDGGVTFPYTVTTASGDFGAAVVTPGTGKHFVWYIGTDYPNQTFSSAVIQVSATTIASVEHVTDGAFAATTYWTGWGTVWRLAANTAEKYANGGTVLTQGPGQLGINLVAGRTYSVTYTISNLTASTCRAGLGGTAGTARAISGTFTEAIVCGATAPLQVTFTGGGNARFRIDDVSVTGVTTSSGNSAVNSLETVPPTVTSVAAMSSQSIQVTFNEVNLTSGAATAANYTLSGAGQGSLSATPTSVNGTGPYTLTWSSGEMLNGAAITVAVANVQDAVGNVLGSPNSGTGTGIGTGPVPTVTGPTSPTNDNPIVFTVNFNEALSANLTGAGIVVMGGIATSFSGSGTGPYTVEVLPPMVDGTVTCQVSTGAVQDLAGNDNSVGSLALTSDRTAPTPVVTGPPSPSSADKIVFSINFGGAVTGLDVSEITVLNGTKGTLTDLGAGLYTLDVTPAGNGVVSCQVGQNAAFDAAGNGNVVSNNLQIESDRVAPTCVVTGPSPATNVTPITFDITFSEAVTGLLIDDITVTGGTKNQLSDLGGGLFTLTVTPSAEVTVTCQVPADAAQDQVSYGNNASNSLSIDYDVTKPNCNVSGPSSPTNQNPIVFYLVFNESVVGLTIDAVTVTGGTKDELLGSAGSYTLSVIPATDGLVSCGLAADSVQDEAGNTNNQSTPVPLTIEYDGTAPTVTLDSTAPGTVNETIFVTAVLSETSVNFVAGDVATSTLVNASPGVLGGSGKNYSFTLTPTISGTGVFSVQVDAGKFTDAAGNPNAASNVLSRNYDDRQPSVTLSSASPALVNGAVTVDVVLSTASTNFASSDVVPVNALAGGFAGSGTAYSFTLTPIADGPFSAQVGADTFTDSVGNLNTASNELAFEFDSIEPEVVLVEVVDGTSVGLTFSEPVDAVSASEAANYTISGLGQGSLNAFPSMVWQDDVDGYLWRLWWSMGEMRNGQNLTVTAALVTDLAGNEVDAANNSGTDVGGAIGIPPTVTINSLLTNDRTPRLTGSAVEVGGLTSIDVTVNGLTYSAVLNTVGGGLYDWYADVTTQLPYGFHGVLASAVDDAGNTGIDNTANELTLDPNAPTTVEAIVRADSNPTNAAAVHFIVRFSLPVSGVSTADFVLHAGSVADATITSVTGAGDTRTVTVNTGTLDGTVGIDLIDDNSIVDNLSRLLGGPAVNDGDFSTGQVYTVYRGRPQVQLSTGGLRETNSAPIAVTIYFSAAVTGFDLTDLVAGHATLSNFTQYSTSIYSVKLTPSPVDYQGAITLDLGADAAQDAATNGNDAAEQLSVVYDTIAPEISISAPTEYVSETGTVSYFVDYTGAEGVDLQLDDIHLYHTDTASGQVSILGAKGDFTREIVIGEIYGNGSLFISIDPGTSWDAAGNTDAGIAPGACLPFETVPRMPATGAAGLALLSGAFAWASVRRLRRKQ